MGISLLCILAEKIKAWRITNIPSEILVGFHLIIGCYRKLQDQRVPLYERIKFLAIYSSNLDEFFRVRVASLRSFKELKKKTRKKLAIKPKKELKEIRNIVHQQQTEFGRIFREELIPELESNGILLVRDDQYDADQKEFARKYFFEKIYPLLHPVILEAGQQAPFLENKGLYFIATLEDSPDLALVSIPSGSLPRFIELPDSKDSHSITFLDDLIRFKPRQSAQPANYRSVCHQIIAGCGNVYRR